MDTEEYVSSFKLVSFNGICTKTHKAGQEKCEICLVKLDNRCSQCLIVNKQCSVIYGDCNHAFHGCCIELDRLARQQQNPTFYCPFAGCQDVWIPAQTTFPKN